MEKQKFLKTGEFAREIGKSKQTVVNMEKSGRLLPHHVDSTGYRYYTWEQVEQVLKGGI